MTAGGPLMVPEWVCTLVGQLVLDNEALRRELSDSDSDSDPGTTDHDAGADGTL